MIRDMLAGAIAGGIATLAMSPFMAPRVTRAVAEVVPDAVPLEEFPPRRVVQEAEAKVSDGELLSERAEDVATWVSHVAFGMGMGALYGAVARPMPRDTGAITGTAFGLTVWAVSYLGRLPVFGVSTGTASGHPDKLPFPFVAHVVYGLTTGVVYDRLR